MGKNIKDLWSQTRSILESSGQTQEAIAEGAGVSQPSVSRVLERCPRRHGGAFKKLCIYADSLTQTRRQEGWMPIEDEVLASAIHEVWNGTPEHAAAIAAMIRAAGALARLGTN